MGQIYIMEPIEDAPHLKNLKIDVAIIAANGDYRTYAGIEDLLRKGITLGEVYVLKFGSQTVMPGTPQYELYHRYTKLQTSVTEMEFSDDTIRLEATALKGKNVLLDITGFSIPNLFRMLFVLREVLDIRDLHALYVEPQHYIFNSDTFDSYAYFVGEREYRALDEFYVSGADSRELLAIFLGFDRMTSSVVKDAVDPTETVLINGFPAMTPKLKDISLLNNRELIAVIGKPQYSVKTNNPFASYNVLTQIQRNYPDMLINVCALGTKTMALGAGVYALQHKNIKLSYAYTKQYALQISEGISRIWYYHFKL